MDELQKLYDALSRDGYYTKSFEEFQVQYEDPSYRKKVFDVVSRDGLFTKSRAEFDQKYSPLKKKENEEVTVSVSEDGLSEPQEIDTSALEVQTSADMQPEELQITNKAIESSQALASVYPEGVDPQLVTTGPDSQYLIPTLFPTEDGGFETIEVQDINDPNDPAVVRAKELGVIQFFGGGNEVDTVARDQVLEGDFRRLAQLDTDTYEGTLFDRERQGEGFDRFTNALSEVDADLIDFEEEYVVPKMNYLFKDYGFQFEETGIGDAMTVTASNGETTEINLDTFLEMGDDEQAKNLRKFLRENKAETSALNNLSSQAIVAKNEEEIVETVKVFNNETERFVENANAFAEEYMAFSADLKRLEGYSREYLRENPELQAEYDAALQKNKDYMAQYEQILKAEEDFKAKGAELDRIAGEYFTMESEQGTFGTAILNKLALGTNKGSKAMARLAFRFLYATEVDEEVEQSLVEANASQYGVEIPDDIEGETDRARYVEMNHPMVYEQILDKDKDQFLKQMLYGDPRFRNPFSQTAATTDISRGMIDAIDEGTREFMMSGNTTEAYEKLASESFLGGAILGLAESVPGMLAGKTPMGWAQRTAQMYALASEAVYDEMEENPEFDNVSEDEKRLVAVPVGVAVGALETLGFRNVIAQKGLLNGVISRALGRSTSNTTSKAFADFIKEDVENLMARGLLSLGASGLAEFETGFFQEGAELAIKSIYNEVKDKEMFQTPDSLVDGFVDMLYAGAQEAVGGFVMGTIPAAANMAQGNRLPDMSDSQWGLFKELMKDDNYKKMYLTQLKQKVAAGEMTSKQAKQAEAELNQLLGILPQIEQGRMPVDFTEAQQKEVVQLLLEQQRLESKNEGLRPVLRKRNEARIADIDARIEEMIEQNAAAQQAQQAEEQGIAEFTEEGVSSRTQEETTEGVTEEEAGDIEEFFGEETETTERVGDNLSLNKRGDASFTPDQRRVRDRVVRTAKLGARAISKALPNVRIVLHESNDEFLKYTGRDGRAEYLPEEKVIHVNLSSATASSVPHEIFHAVFIEKVKTDENAARAAEKMIMSVRKTLKDDSALAKRIDDFASNYEANFQNEERLAELVGILSSEYRTLAKPAKSKVVEFLRNIARRFGIELGSDFGKTDESVVDLLNTIARKTRKGEIIEETDIALLEQIPYSEGEVVTPTETASKPQPRQDKDVFKGIPFVEEIPVVSMQEFVESVDGKVFAVTSDATKVGFDSNNERVDGGFGYTAFKENLAGNIGFASLDTEVAKKTMAKIAKNFNAGDVIGVMIMVQNPSATIGNYYGGKYLGRALKQLQEADGAAYQLMVDEVAKLLQTNKTIRNALKKKQTEQKLIDLLRDPSKFTENEFAQEWIADTTFEVRREMLKAMIIPSAETRTNKSTPIYKTMLKDAGFNLQDFLMEYGDVKLIGENNLKEDNGGFLVGGFKMTVPKSADVAGLMAEVETKGFTHPQFNGKLPSTGEHFLFDGLYPIQENLQEFAVGETRIGEELQEEADKRVRRLAKKKGVGVFERKFTDKDSDNYVPPSKRGYRNLSTTAKIIFKKDNQDLLVEATPQLASGVARGMGLKTKGAIPASTEFSPARRQQKSMNEIIGEAREANFRDAVIRDYLIRVRKMKAKVVDAALEVSRDAFEKLPDAFKDMKGGVKAGEALYKKVEKFRKKLERRNARSTYKTDAEIKAMVVEFAQRLRATYDTNAQIQEKVDKYKAKLERNNKRRKTPMSSTEMRSKVAEFRRDLVAKRDAKRDEVNGKITQFEAAERRKNNRRVKPLTEQEIMTAMIEFMESQPEFKQEGDTFVEKGVTKFRKGLSTQQAQLIAALQKNVGIRPTQDMAAKVRRARFAVRERLKGQRDIQSVKRAMRNFIRQALPPELYTKKEVLGLLRKVEVANRDNLENLQGEIEEFVISKNVQSLKRSIDKILNADYETLQSGRRKGVKVDLATREQIEKIRDSILPDDATAEQVAEANESLQRQWNELDKKPDATVAEQMEMVTLQMIIELNNSLVMEDTDANKVAALDIVNATLADMVAFGRSALQAELSDAKKEYDRQFEIAYKEVTGNDIDMTEEDVKQQLEEQKRERGNESSRNRVAKKVKAFARSIAEYIDVVFTSAEGLDGLMDKISIMPGELFGGPLQDLVTGKVDEASRNFKARRMYTEFAVKNKLEELYGKNWQRRARENRVAKTEIALNKAKLKEAQDAYNANPTKETKEALEKVVKQTTRMYSQNEMYYLYNQFKDPANHGAFKNMFGPNYEEVMEEITSKLDKEVKEFADWQVTEFFPELYEHYNEVYKRVYRTNMPWNEHYAGRIYRDGVVPEPLDLLSTNNAFNNSVNGASTRARVENTKKIKQMDGTDALMSYINDMEYFAAYAETIRDINKLFTNEYVRDAIINRHGQKTMNLIDNMISKIANKGTRTEMMASFINSLNNVFIISRLGLSPVIMVKQLTSTFTYANDIGARNWLKYSAKSIPELKKVWTEIRENSVYMQDRKYDGIMKAIESYNETAMQEFVPMPTKDFLVNVAMYMVKFGDRSAIFLGGTPNYMYYKDQALKQGKSEQEAIEIAVRKFERDTKRTQQSADLQDKDVFQTSNPVVRALNMFLTTPKQYLRKEIQAVRALNRKLMAFDKDAGKGSIKENVRTLMMYHVFMPVLFQYVSMGLPGLLRGWRDDDEDDLLRAAAIGNLNGLFILGEVVAALGDYFTGKPWAGESTKSIGVINIVSGIIQKFKRADKLKDPEKKAEAYKKAYMELISISGIPAPTLAKLHDNYEAIISGEADDTGELILRLFNFSEYQIEGPKKDEKKYKTLDELNKEYDRQKRKEEREERKRQKLLEQGLDAIPLDGGLEGSGLESKPL